MAKGIAQLIYDVFPESDLLNIRPSTDLTDLATLKEAAKDCGDSLFRFVVNEAVEGAEGDPIRLADLLRRGIHDLQAVIDALENETAARDKALTN